MNHHLSRVVSFRVMAPLFAALVLVPGLASAKELEVTALGRAALTASQGQPVDPQTVRSQALAEAKRKAIVTAIERVLGPDACKDPRVASKVPAIAEQVPDDRIIDQKGARAGDAYELTITLVVDDKAFRTLLSDAGVAVNTATARASSILAVMDEFITSPRDVKAPLEELEFFSSSKGESSHDRSRYSTASTSASAESRSRQAAVDAQVSSRLSGSERHDRSLDASGSGSGGRAAVKAGDRGSSSVEASTTGSLKGTESTASARTSSSSATASARLDQASENHDDQVYVKLKKFQPQGGAPEKTSQALNAFVGQLQDYDLRVLDNDLFKSKYFKSQPITIEQLQSSEALSKYVTFARADANADFFMVGTSIIIDQGRNPNTGGQECTGVVTLKTYATIDAESIASETFSEASAGLNLNDCAAAVGKKLAAVGGPIIGAKIQDYWKRRVAYGREYVLTLVGKGMTLGVRSAFARAVKAVPGVEGDVQRAASDKRIQIVVTYKGGDPLDQAVAEALSANPAFAALDGKTEGNQVVLCMGPCAEYDGQPGTSTQGRQ